MRAYRASLPLRKGEDRLGMGALGRRSRPIPNPTLPLKGREVYCRPHANPEIRK